jgi:hypothetical protein
MYNYKQLTHLHTLYSRLSRFHLFPKNRIEQQRISFTNVYILLLKKLDQKWRFLLCTSQILHKNCQVLAQYNKLLFILGLIS